MAATSIPPNEREPRNGIAPWIKLLFGSLVLAGAVFALMQGYTPPGPAGDVFRNNMRHDIDATPLFYTDASPEPPTN